MSEIGLRFVYYCQCYYYYFHYDYYYYYYPYYNYHHHYCCYHNHKLLLQLLQSITVGILVTRSRIISVV